MPPANHTRKNSLAAAGTYLLTLLPSVASGIIAVVIAIYAMGGSNVTARVTARDEAHAYADVAVGKVQAVLDATTEKIRARDDEQERVVAAGMAQRRKLEGDVVELKSMLTRNDEWHAGFAKDSAAFRQETTNRLIRIETLVEGLKAASGAREPNLTASTPKGQPNQ